MFNEALSEAELSAWQSLTSVAINLLWNHRSAGYEKEIEELLKSFCQLGTRMSINHKELWRYEVRFGWAFLPRYSHYERVLPRPVGFKLSFCLLLVLETGCSECESTVGSPWNDLSSMHIFFCRFFILIKVSKAGNFVEGDLKAPFSKATTPRCWNGRYSFPLITPLYPWSLP